MKRKIITNLLKKTLLKGYFLLFLAMFSTNLIAQITVDVSNKPIKEILKLIETKSSYRFFYNESLKGLDKISTLRVKDANIDKTMSLLLDNTEINYKLEKNNLVVLVTKTKIGQGESKKLTGLVTDEKGEPIIGASILIKGQSKGTITDVTGRFTIEIENNSIIRISYIGYQTQEVAVGQNTYLSVSLIENNKTLDEIVVVGYGTKKKRDIIGSVATVKTEELNKSASLSAINNLQGKASGLNISNSAAGYKVMVRGVHSINSGNDPLWVVDGIPSSPPNSEEIESIEILKDASATAIYGSRGSNGVIIVTTKRGKEGKTELEMNIHSGVTLLTKTDVSMGYANNNQWFDIMDIVSNNSNISAFDPMTVLNEDARYLTTPISADEARLVRDSWFAAITRPGNYQNAAISLNTGSKNGTTYMNANFRQSQDNIISNDNNQMNFRVNSDYKVTKDINVGAKIHFSRTVQNNNETSIYMTRRVPWQPVFYSLDPERTGYWNPHNNPLTTRDTKYRQLLSDNIRVLGGLYAELTLPFLKGLALRTEYNINVGIVNTTDWKSAIVNPVTVSEAGSTATEQSIIATRQNANAYFKYNNTFGKHTVSGVMGLETENEDAYVRLTSGRNLTTEYPQLGSTPGVLTSGKGYYQYEQILLSVFGRADYNYAGKYLAGISFRRDGSSIFTPEYRWGTFTAYSMGWIISEESYLKDKEWISLLKLRGSMGQTGNNSIPANKNLTTFDMDVRYGYGDETLVSGGKKPATIGNNSLTWETTSSYDIGLDYSFVNNKLNGSIAYYFQDVNGLVLAASVPQSTGLSGNQEIWGNLGRIYNYGFEFNISSVNLDNKHFKWTTDFNFSTSRNWVVKLTSELDSKGIPIYHDQNKIVGLVSKVGGMIREFYMPEYGGVDPEKGVEMIYELDKTHFDSTGETVRTGRLIPATQGNMQNNRFVLNGKSVSPTFYGGFSNTFSYRDFDFNFMFNFSGGNYIYDQEMATMETPARGRNPLRADLLEKSWKQPGDNVQYPRLVYNSTQPYDWDTQVLNPSSPTGKGDWLEVNGNYSNQLGSHSRYLYKGDFLKLKHVELGYNLPQSLLNHIGLKNLRFYVAADNLYTLTDYPGWDPESGLIRSGLVGLASYTLNPFLVTATYMVGFQLKL